MRVDDAVRKCVGYVALQMADESYRLVGTCFFVYNSITGICYIVTAKHVIKGIESKGLANVFLRLNVVEGGNDNFITDLSDWIFHKDENVDIAIIPVLGMHPRVDHMMIDNSHLADEHYINENQVGTGDEVFIVGLFRHHHGNHTNLPIVRSGNIAGMPSEKIQTKNHLMDGYLIEARSIGGLSGSPVFTNLAFSRALMPMGNQVGMPTSLLGLIYGHFDSLEDQIDDATEDVVGSTNVNVGIAIVTPITKLIEMFYYPEAQVPVTRG